MDCNVSHSDSSDTSIASTSSSDRPSQVKRKKKLRKSVHSSIRLRSKKSKESSITYEDAPVTNAIFAGHELYIPSYYISEELWNFLLEELKKFMGLMYSETTDAFISGHRIPCIMSIYLNETWIKSTHIRKIRMPQKPTDTVKAVLQIVEKYLMKIFKDVPNTVSFQEHMIPHINNIYTCLRNHTHEYFALPRIVVHKFNPKKKKRDDDPETHWKFATMEEMVKRNVNKTILPVRKSMPSLGGIKKPTDSNSETETDS